MKLRNIDFDPVLSASGVQGFFGEGYPYHKYLNFVPGFSFKGMTFVAKTTTLSPRKGNMPLQRDNITPRELYPKCIVVKFYKGVVLNSVGLSGPGAEYLFETGLWQKRTEPFFISFMSVESNPEDRIMEIKEFVKMFLKYLPYFRTSVGLQINFSCPNVGLHPGNLIDEVGEVLDIASQLNVPLMPKFNVMLLVDVACEISEHKHCDAICISNTIPWGQLPEKIDWEGLFGTSVSPLAEFGGGGLSGKPLLPILCQWVREATGSGIKVPINSGGGILFPDDIDLVYHAGAASVSLGSIAMLRPWNMKKVVIKAHQCFS